MLASRDGKKQAFEEDAMQSLGAREQVEKIGKWEQREKWASLVRKWLCGIARGNGLRM